MSPKILRPASFIVSAAMLVAGLVLGAAPAANAVTYPMGTISGVVSPTNGDAAPDEFIVRFQLEADTYPLDPDFDFVNIETVPDSVTGAYSLSVRAGRYLVYVEPQSSNAKSKYPLTYYPAAPIDYLASWVTVTEGNVTTADVAPPLGGFIAAEVNFAGTVTLPTMGWQTYDSTGSFPMGGPTGPRIVSFPATTSREGTWVIGPIMAGTYRVGTEWILSDEYFIGSGTRWRTQYWDHVSSVKNASPVVVQAGQTTTGLAFDIVKSPEASISGVVYDSSHQPIAGAYVAAESTNGEMSWSSVTAADGSYTINYLGAGTYTVFANAQDEYPMTSYGYAPNSATYEGATPVILADDINGQYGIDVTVQSGRSPLRDWTRYQIELPPPASTSSELLALLQARGVAIDSLDDWGATATQGAIFINNLPWSGSRDSAVDIYGYSNAKWLGSVAVRDDMITTNISLTGFTAGDHHILLVGRDSGDVRAADLTVQGAALANTGPRETPLGGLSAFLVFGGMLLVVASVRMRQKAKLARRDG